MKRQCSKKGCEFEVDYACECLSLQTYWCQFHLGEHLKLSNRTHAFDTIIAEPSQESNDSIFDFLEKEKTKIDKLKEIAMASLLPNLYNSKISIEETFKKLDSSLEEINALIKKTTKNFKKDEDFNIKELNSSELYNARLWFILDHLKTKKSKILKSVNNEPNTERDFRRTCYLYENSFSDSSLNRAYHEYIKSHDKLTSLYLIGQNDDRTNLFIYNTERESEEIKVLKIKKESGSNACIAQLPNGKLFCCIASKNTYIIHRNYNVRKLPSCKVNLPDSAIYFNKSVYCFGGYEDQASNLSIRFDLVKNRWFRLSPMIKKARHCSSVIFNRNILITGKENSNILLYSTAIDSFSYIPYNFLSGVSKFLINGEKRLYLIEILSSSIFESDIDDEYTWKWIACTTIYDYDVFQVYCSYNKGGIYISIFSKGFKRHYFKFDLDQKALTEIALYNEHVAAKRSSSNHWDVECYNNTFKFDSDDAKTYINKGHSLFNLGELLRNINCLNAEINCDPRYSESYMEKGGCLCELGRNLEAIECFNQAIKFDPNIELSYLRANKIILCDEGREGETIDCYNERIKNNPSHARCYIDKGNALCEFRRYFEAIECYSEAVRVDSKSFEAYVCKGNALSSLDRKSEAIECYNEAIKINSKDLNAYFYKGKVLSELGRDFEAIECCNEVLNLEKDKNARFYILKGKTLSQMGRNVEKNQCYIEAIKNLNDSDAKTYFREVFIECDLETKNQALEHYNWYIEKIYPYSEEPYIRKGYALYNLDRKIEAIQCYNKLFNIKPKNKIQYIKDILDLPNYNKLFETKIEKVEVGTMNEEGLHFLDWIIELIERHSELIEMKSHYAYAYVLKGCTLHLAGKYLEEVECYNKATAINPNDANIYFAKDDALNKQREELKQ